MRAPLDLRAVEERLRYHLATAGDRELGYPQAECCDMAEDTLALVAYIRALRVVLADCICDTRAAAVLGAAVDSQP